ncbi:hypothetical protein ISS03_03340 [Patescibacteria group bacterium]|nr:hypothetical protein [Patescibacteria group bacterium]
MDIEELSSPEQPKKEQPPVEKVADISRKSLETLDNPKEVITPTREEGDQLSKQPTFKTPTGIGKAGLGSESHIQNESRRKLKEIESVLSKNLEELYKGLPEEKRTLFKTKGEATAVDIKHLLENKQGNSKAIFKLLLGWLKSADKGQVKSSQVKKIIVLIKIWLRILDPKDSYYIEQAAKIKADEIIKLTRSW